jgi:hypothetical protein
MVDKPQVLQHLGPYLKHPPVEAFSRLSADTWVAYHDIIGGYERVGETPREHLISRMMVHY